MSSIVMDNSKPRIRVKAGDATGASAKLAPSRRQFSAFDAGKSGRRLRAVPTTSDAINRLIRAYGKNVLGRSRYLCQNNPYAASAKEAWVNAVIGSGIKPSSLMSSADLKKKVHELWRDWTDESDADGLTDFYGQMTMIAGEIFEAGECFVRLRARLPSDGLTVPFQLQIIPAEMLDIAYNVSATLNSNRIECGIEFDFIGRRIAYHFFTQHPNNDVFARNASLPLRTRVAAEEVLHLYKPMQAGQIRGIPHTVSGIVKCAVFDAYEDAELERKRTAALFGGFITRPARDDASFPLENGLDLNASIPLQGNAFGLEPGVMVDLAEGEDVKFAEPADVGSTFEPFEYRQLLGIAAGFGVPYMHMTGDQRQTSYGTQRAAELMFRRRVEAVQHQIIVFQFCRPIWNRWLLEAVLAQEVDISLAAYNATPRQFNRVRWIPPKWDWIDPLKDRQAEALAVAQGWKSRDDVIEAEGYDPEENDDRIKASQDRAEKLNLQLAIPITEQVVPNEADGTGANDTNAPGPPAPADQPDDTRKLPKKVRAQLEDEMTSEDRYEAIIDTNLAIMQELARPKPAPRISIAIHTPREGKKKTTIVAHDENGRIKETITEPVG
jgi:lambda family phage portal protein